MKKERSRWWDWLKKGLTFKAIGEKLFISPATVETHALNIYKKAGVNSRVRLLYIMEFDE
jgi:DNA-binding CsgD family transcriptional regulator